MKKSKRFFSFVGVALCAVMLLGSVGTLGSKHVAEAATTTSLNKTYGLDKLQELNITNDSTATYLEYGEYPQTRVSDNDQQSLRAKLKSEVYANKEFTATALDTPAEVIAQRKKASDTTSFSYNADNGYFTLKKQVGNLPAGTKIYEYISGVDALQKYPLYQASTKGEKTFQDTRSYATYGTLDTISKAVYHNSNGGSTTYTACDCSTCKNSGPNYDVPKCIKTKGGSMQAITKVDWLSDTGHAYKVEWNARNDTTNEHGTRNGRMYPDGGDGVSETNTYTLSYNPSTGKITPLGLGSSEGERQRIKIIEETFKKVSLKGTPKKIQFTFKNVYTYDSALWGAVSWVDYITTYITAYIWEGNEQGCPYCYINHHNANSNNVRNVTAARSIVGQKFSSSIVDSKYDYNNVNYFLVEPIKWKIVENYNGQLTLQSDIILDSMNYNLFTSNGTNFNQSYLRNWLNNGSKASAEKYNVLNSSGDAAGAPISERNTNSYSYLSSTTSDVYTGDAADKARMINATDSEYKKNYAAYESTATTYTNTNPTFYKMAFTNEKTVKADEVLVKITQKTTGTVNYNAKEDSGVEADNYVTIPYNQEYVSFYTDNSRNDGQIKFSLGTQKSAVDNNQYPYSDFAEATGLVCHYNSGYSSYGSSYNNGLLWVWGSSDVSKTLGYKDGLLHQKTVAQFSNSGTITLGDNTKSYNQINQTGGVVPVIKMDLTTMLGAGDDAVSAFNGVSGVVSSIDEAEFNTDIDDNDAAITQEISKIFDTASFTAGTTLKFVNKGNASTSIKVTSYEVNREGSDYEITVNLTGAASVKYLKFAFGDTNFINNVDATGQGWNVTGTYPYFLVLKQLGTSSFTFKFDNGNDAQEKYRNMIDQLTNDQRTFHMYVFAVTEDVEKVGGIINKTVLTETYVSDSDIKQGSITFSTPSLIAGSQEVNIGTTTITKYEGESYQLPTDTFGEGYMQYYAGYDVAKFGETAGMEYTVLGTPVIAKNKSNTDETTIVYKRTGWHKVNNSDYDHATLITGSYEPQVNQEGVVTGFSEIAEPKYITHLYRDGIEQSFSIGVKPDGTKDSFSKFINNVIYMEYTDKDGKTQTKDFSGGKDVLNTQNYYRLDTEFKIFVKTKYLSSFSGVQDLMAIGGGLQNPFVQIQAYGTSGQVVFDTKQAEGVTGKATIAQTSATNWTYTTTVGSYTPTLVVTGPHDSKVNGLVIEKYYTFKMSGIPSGGLASGEKYAFVVMPNEISESNLNPDKYTFNYTSEKTTLKHATVTTGMEDPIKAKIENSAIQEIDFNSSLVADIAFNKGYSLDRDSNDKAIMPTMNFDYGAQALDDKGYSITKNARYSADKNSKLGTASSAYVGEYIRLDADGNMLNFDNNHNLKYYHDQDELTNIKGAYGFDNSANQVFDFMIPMLTLDINEKNDNVSGDFAKKVLFVPYISVEKGGNQYLPHNLFDPEHQTGLSYEKILTAFKSMCDGIVENDLLSIEYKPANLTDREMVDGLGKVKYTPYTYIQNSLSLLSDVTVTGETNLRTIVKEKLVALGFGNTEDSSDATMWLDIRDYYEKVFNISLMGSYDTSSVKNFIAGCINTFIDSLGNNEYDEKRLADDRIRLLSGDEWAFDRQSYITVGDETSIGKEENYVTIIINRSRNKDEQKMAMRGNNSYSLSAIYNHYQWTSSSHTCNSVFSFMNEYGNEMVGLNLVNEAYQSSKLTPVDEADGSSFPIWSIKVNTELNNDGAGYEQTGNGYKYFELSSGEKHANWHYESRQWLYYNIATGEATKMFILNGVPCITLDGVRWGAEYVSGKEACGKRALFKMEQNDLGNWVTTSTQMTGEYIVTFTRPITATVYVLEKDDALRPCVEVTGEEVMASEQYRKGDIVIRLSANNVVSRINMSIKDHMISNHQYPVEFYSNFGGNYVGTTALFDGAFVEPGSTMQGLRDLSEQMAQMVTNDSTGDVIKFIPYQVRNSNNSDYYFMAPIDIVSAAGANDIGLVKDDQGKYRVGGLGGNVLTEDINNGVLCYLDAVSGDHYFFTNEILEFKGWTLVTKDRITNSDPNVRNWANVQFSQQGFFDTTDVNKINKVLFNWEGGFTYNTLTVDDLYNVMLNFTNNSAVVVLEAVYQTIGLKVELFGWNMNNVDAAEADHDHPTYNGVYNILKKHSTYEGLGNFINVSNYSLKNADDLGVPTDIVYGESLKNTVYTTLSNAIDSDTYLNKQATAYGTILNNNNSVWYEQVVDPKTYVQNTIFSGNNIDLNYRNYSDMATVLSAYEKVSIWDNETDFYTDDNRNFYFRIRQEAPNRYNVEAFRKFLIEESKFTNNTKLYQVYETKQANVTFTGFGDVFSSYDYQPTISMGKDFVATFGLADQYSQYLDNISDFLSKFTVTVNTRYNGVLQSADSSFKLSERYASPIKEGETDIVSVTVEGSVITLTIRGVVSDITITGDNSYSRNNYTMKIANPLYDANEELVKDAEGNSLSYGTFYLVSSDGHTKHELKFSTEDNENDGLVEIRTEDEALQYKVTVHYDSAQPKYITLTFEYGTLILLQFERNVAFSQYIDTADFGGNNHRPFTISNSNGTMNMTPCEEYGATQSENEIQWVQGDTAPESRYRILRAVDDYTLTWKSDITLNTYAVSNSSDKYSVTLYDDSDAQDIFNENVVINPDRELTPGEVEARTLEAASYNQNVVMEFTVNPAFSQFVPVLIHGGHVIPFPHAYAGMVEDGKVTDNSRTTVYFAAGNSTIVITATKGEGDALSYYAYNYNGKDYRIEGIAETSGVYAGYYKVSYQPTSGDPYETIGYIRYDEYSSKYYFTLNGVRNAISANLVSYSTMDNLWSDTNKNMHAISLGTADDSNNTSVISDKNANYYTFTAHTINGEVNADGTISNATEIKTISDLTTLSHGTMLRFKVVMKSNYTQTIPHFAFIIGEKTYQLADAIAEQGATFEFDTTKTITTSDGKQIRTNKFTIGELTFTVTQTVTLDNSFDDYLGFRTQMGLDRNENENKLYKTATYTFDFVVTDSFTMAHGSYVTNEVVDDDPNGDQKIDKVHWTPIYTTNVYYVIFNKYANSSDQGPLQYIPVDEDGNQLTARYYYQEVGQSQSYKATNPFREVGEGILGPDGITTIDKTTFSSSTIAGYTYSGAGSFTTTQGAIFSFNNTIDKHTVLRAQYTEEEYTTKIELMDSKYGTAWYQSATASSYSKLTSSSTIVANGNVVSYTKTTFRTKFVMNSKYDNSSMRFSVSTYGTLKFPTDSGVTFDGQNYRFSNTIGGSQTDFKLVVDETQKSTNNIVIYNYYIGAKNIAQIIVNETAKAIGTRNGDSKDSTIYELVIVSPIDAGNTVSDPSPSTLTVGMSFVVNSDETKANAISHENVYTIAFLKPTFDSTPLNTTVEGQTGVTYGASEYNTYRGWTNYPTVKAGVVENDTNSIVSDHYVVSIPHGQKVKMASSLPEGTDEKDTPTLSGDTNTIYYIYQSVPGFTFNGWSDKGNSNANWKDGDPIDDKFRPTMTINDATASGAIYQDYTLYAKYKESSCNGISYINNNVETAGTVIFQTKSYSKNSSVKYSDEVTATFTLSSIYSGSNGIKFEVVGASLKSVSYVNNGTQANYVLVLSYFTATDRATIQISNVDTEADLIKSTHSITFKDYTYSSTIDQSNAIWTETINVNPASITIGTGATVDRLDGIQNNVVVSSVTNWGSVNWDLENRNNGGLLFHGWIYIKHYDVPNADDVVEIIRATLNGYVPNGQMLLGHEVGMFYADETVISSSMYVVPYFTRNTYDITINQMVEGTVLDDSDERVMSGYANNLPYTVPYGFPVLNTAIEGNIAGQSSIGTIWQKVYTSYNTIKNIDSAARAINADNAYVNHEFENYYANDVVNTNGLEGILIDGTLTTININFTKKIYTVTIMSSTSGTAVEVCKVEIKYGENVKLDIVADEDGNTISDLLHQKEFTNASTGNTYYLVDESKGQYLAGWYYNGSTSMGEEFTVLADSTIAPFVRSQDYLFKAIADGFAIDAIGVDGLTAELDGDGFFSVSHNQFITIGFYPNDGWTTAPVVTLSIDGVVIASGSNTEEIGNNLSLTSTKETNNGRDYITVKLQGFGQCLEITNGARVLITLSPVQNLYEAEIINGQDIVVEYASGNVTFTYDETKSAYKYGETLAVVFSYDKFVSHGETFNFTVAIDSKYASTQTRVDFVIRDGVNDRRYALSNGTERPDNATGITYYDFTFANVQGNITIDIDEAASTIRAKQFTITYNYLFGGGVNGWEYLEEGKQYTFEKNENYQHFVDVRVDGTKLETPSAGLTEAKLAEDYPNYTIYNNVWYVLKDNYTELNNINEYNINDYCNVFDMSTHNFTDSFNVFAFYIVETYAVSPEDTSASKGGFELPSINNQYVADHKGDNTFAKGYTFSYVLDASYSMSQPVISIVGASASYDFIVIDMNKLTGNTTVKKSDSVIYTVVKVDANNYTYSVQALGAGEATYSVSVANGVYTIKQGETEVATASLNGLKTTITLKTVTEAFAVNVNDETFDINKYSIKFVYSDGSSEEVFATYGSKLSNIPTEETSFIQKVVYVVTYADGTTKKLSGKELQDLEITEDLTVELSVELNLVILIPLVVGAVVIIVVIVVVIAKAASNAGYKRSSGSANSAAFDKLNQNKPSGASNDASKKSDKPYNPYIGNRDKK